MIFVQHNQTAPRKLSNRYAQGTPNNPTNSWQNFRNKNKKELKDNLLAIQNGLCAYCEIRLDDEIGNHLEHIEPKSKNPDKTFEYTNIVYSCITDSLTDNEDSNPESCGHAKNDKVIEIKPTDKNCEDCFSYDLFGRVIPSLNLSKEKEQQVKNTITTLNLNCKRLKRQRESVIKEGFKIISELLESEYALNDFLDLELNTVNDKYFSFINLRREHFESYKC
jgi:uncharacterized protein (TIGR02646 family)